MYITNAIKGRYPTLAELESARKKAKNTTDLVSRFGRDLAACLIKLCKMPRVKGILNRRQVAVTAYKWNFVTDTNEDMSEHVIRLSKAVNLILSYHTDLLFGSLLFRVVQGANKIDNYANITLEHIELTDYEKIDNNTFYLYDANNDKTLVDIRETKEYIYLTDNDNELGGIIDSIADNIVYLINLMPKWDRLNNRMQGVIIGSTDTDVLNKAGTILGIDANKLQGDLKSTLENIGNDAGNALQTLSGIEIKLASLVESAAANSYDLYKKTVEVDIAIALLGQANTTELPSSGGSYAALKVLNTVTQDLLYSDINNVTAIINQFLAIEYYLSFGKELCPYRFELTIDDFEDTEANSRTLQYIASSGIPIKVKQSELYEKIGYSKPDEDDEIIELSTNSVLSSNNPVV